MAAQKKGFEDWLQILKKSKKTCMVQGDRRKVHYLLQDGRELVEEFDLKGGQLMVRKWRRKTKLGREGSWECEVGESYHTPISLATEQMTASTSNPICVRKDTVLSFQWRIRNLPFPLSNYSVSIDDAKECIIIKTVNKKYYKKLHIPDLQRCGQALSQEALSIAHANNTLVVTYKKPDDILKLEKELQAELKKLKTEKEGDVECNQS